MINRPKLLLVDEPSLGLSPRLVKDAFAVLRGFKAECVPQIIVEQNARAALALSTHASVLENGSVTLAGDSAALAADQRVTELYLGAAH